MTSQCLPVRRFLLSSSHSRECCSLRSATKARFFFRYRAWTGGLHLPQDGSSRTQSLLLGRLFIFSISRQSNWLNPSPQMTTTLLSIKCPFHVNAEFQSCHLTPPHPAHPLLPPPTLPPPPLPPLASFKSSFQKRGF